MKPACDVLHATAVVIAIFRSVVYSRVVMEIPSAVVEGDNVTLSCANASVPAASVPVSNDAQRNAVVVRPDSCSGELSHCAASEEGGVVFFESSNKLQHEL